MARMSWHEACQLDRSLTALNPFFPEPAQYAQTLTGGLTNRCWKVVTHRGAYVWRPSTPITKAFSISRFQEYQILSALEHNPIAPKPHYICEQGLLVDWIEGIPLRDGLPFDDLLDTMVSVHQANTQRIPVAPFNYTARVDHYWILIDDTLKSDSIRGVYETWRRAPSLADVGHVLCHFDLAGYNMVRTTQGITVIDWEYACIADPRLDLTLSIDVCQHDPQDAVFRYCQKRGVDGIDDWVEGVMAWQPRAKMMAMLWYLLAYQLWGEEQYLTEATRLEGLFCS